MGQEPPTPRPRDSINIPPADVTEPWVRGGDPSQAGGTWHRCYSSPFDRESLPRVAGLDQTPPPRQHLKMHPPRNIKPRKLRNVYCEPERNANDLKLDTLRKCRPHCRAKDNDIRFTGKEKNFESKKVLRSRGTVYRYLPGNSERAP